MPKDESSTLEGKQEGKKAYPSRGAGKRRLQLPASCMDLERSLDASRPRTALVITGKGVAGQIGLQCVSMLANIGHRVVAVLSEGEAPHEFIKGPVANRIACISHCKLSEARLRNAIGALPERFHLIDTLVGMVNMPACRHGLLQKDAHTPDTEPASSACDLVKAARAVLPMLSTSRRGNALAVLARESGADESRPLPSAHHLQAESLIAALRTELSDLGVRFTRIQCGPLEDQSNLRPDDVIQALAWTLSQPHHLAVCDIDIRSAPLARPMLTRREQEVLVWTARGKTTDEISRILDLSISGVNFHISNFVTKLHTCNKMAAVVRAAQLGILS